MRFSDKQLQEMVLNEGLITPEQLVEVNDVLINTDASLYDVLVDRKLITDERIGELVAKAYGTPFVNLTDITIPDNLLHVLPERVAKRKRCVVFERGRDGIKIAMEDPQDRQIIDLIQSKTGEAVLVFCATPKAINKSLDVYKIDIKQALEDFSDDQAQEESSAEDEEAPISQLVDMLFEHAFREKASDIHMEPQDNQGIIRYRVDGMLHDVAVSSKVVHERIISRLKVLARLRTDEHHSTQDGKIRAHINGQMVDIRLSILPIVDGEKAVMRILSTHGRPLTLTDLGMRPPDLHRVKTAYEKSFGMVLSTGPTGAGKSTSIYAILRILNVREKNITTIEDPVEYRLKGVNQINVNPKTNLTFAAGLRSILRQDPNIVFVGEIRDGETANIAVNAALTGHLVLSTLHTNDAATAMVRLIEMKVEPFLVASTVNVIIAQRLVRKICNNCRNSKRIDTKQITDCFGVVVTNKHVTNQEQTEVFGGVGCKMCGNTGYSGRLGLFEVLVVTPKIRELIAQKTSSDHIAQTAIEEGMTTMLEDGLIKVLQGLTTMEEVIRVTKTESV
ncbi:MAG TPA: GspE/PulE family protein [Candidatus Woesebacteria bacterium]|nr:GspE/PulE family protein [Candidatus Woesebacteria bacterium]HNS94748.1 GspE/PulE family protein [Candidatus Woesebacteria bacterium]